MHNFKLQGWNVSFQYFGSKLINIRRGKKPQKCHSNFFCKLGGSQPSTSAFSKWISTHISSLTLGRYLFSGSLDTIPLHLLAQRPDMIFVKGNLKWLVVDAVNKYPDSEVPEGFTELYWKLWRSNFGIKDITWQGLQCSLPLLMGTILLRQLCVIYL